MTCHYTHVPDTAGRNSRGGGKSVDFIFVGLTSYLQNYNNHRFYTPRTEKDNVVNPTVRELLLKEL